MCEARTIGTLYLKKIPGSSALFQIGENNPIGQRTRSDLGALNLENKECQSPGKGVYRLHSRDSRWIQLKKQDFS